MSHQVKINFKKMKMKWKRLNQYQQKDWQKIWQLNLVFLMKQKYFSSGIFQNYLLFTRGKKTLNILVAPLGLICGNLLGCQKKILKI